MVPWFKESIVVLGSIFCEFVISWFFFLFREVSRSFFFIVYKNTVKSSFYVFSWFFSFYFTLSAIMHAMSSNAFSQFCHFFSFSSQFFYVAQWTVFMFFDHWFGCFVNLFCHTDTIFSRNEGPFGLRCCLME